jgi:hypothetical protein
LLYLLQPVAAMIAKRIKKKAFFISPENFNSYKVIKNE